MNLRPLGYEPSELPNCSTPRCENQVYGSAGGCPNRVGQIGQGAPSQHGRIQPQPSHRSCEVSQRIWVPQLGHGSVRSAMGQP